MPADKTRAWTPIETADAARETTLKRAYLLCQRRKYDEAERLLKMLLRANPNDRDAAYLLGRIDSTERAEKEEDEGRRAWRYRLGLQSSWARFGAYVGGLASAVYGVWSAIPAVRVAQESGLQHEITTMLSRSRGKAGPTYYVLWTRPAYYDLLYGLAFLVTGVVAILVVNRLSKGAAMWEEIGNPHEMGW